MMMYDPIFAKSFTHYERKRFGCCILVLFFIFAFGISSTFLPLPISPVDEAIKLQFSISSGIDLLMIDDDTTTTSNPIAGNAWEDLKMMSNDTKNKAAVNETCQPVAMKEKVICRNSNYCEIEGDIRIQPHSSTVHIVTSSNSTNSWVVQPNPRNGTSRVKNWTITTQKNDVVKCTQTHTLPAILFSVGGFTGNFFHDFADILFPLYSTSFDFQKEVQFLVTDYKSWWVNKFNKILFMFTRYEILDLDRETSETHCYNKLIVGLKFHKELIPSESGTSMPQFRSLLRQAYSLKRETALISRERNPPRLMIVSRKRIRVITNEEDLSRLAAKLGYDVVSAEAGAVSNLSRSAEIANSCDVILGVHGAGLTNVVFVPDNGVLIQVVPIGGIEGFARRDFGDPVAGMNVRYLEYRIGVRESSLSLQYDADHPVLKRPKSNRRWDEISSIYLNQQNVTIDLRRFRRVLVKALNLLRH